MVSRIISVLFLPMLLAAMLYTVTLASAISETSFPISSFDEGEMAGWKEKIFADKTDYQLVKLDGKTVLQASSQGSASGLLKKTSINLREYPYLNWRWQIENRIDSGDERKKSGDDYAARIYIVINDRFFFWKSQALSYVWANKTPKGAVWNNAFAGDSVKMLALRSDEDKTGIWVNEKRNVYEDLKLAFGKAIVTIDAVAIMTDTDNSSSKARAYYSDIFFSVD
jgi:hypothetical protein